MTSHRRRLRRVLAASVSFAFVTAPAGAACRLEPTLKALPRQTYRDAIGLLARKGVSVAEVCGEAHTPRFYARFRSDPQSGPNAKLYNSLYLALMERLKLVHATLIDLDGEVAIGLTRNRRGDLTLDVAPWSPRR